MSNNENGNDFLINCAKCSFYYEDENSCFKKTFLDDKGFLNHAKIKNPRQFVCGDFRNSGFDDLTCTSCKYYCDDLEVCYNPKACCFKEPTREDTKACPDFECVELDLKVRDCC